MDKYIGKLLGGRYEIIDVVGVGGMAVVYRARCHVLNRYVAVKILKDEYAKDPEIRKRFSIESQAVAKLSHHNIVSVYDVGSENGTDYIVMELIEGVTLKEYLQKKGRLTWQEAVFFAEQICRALIHAHSRGIIHQDIKPQNVIILRDGTAKLTDFGIASFATTQETRVVQEAIGSVHYISPEQAKGSKIDYRTDIYSLGVVMYEMLTGKLPFEGETALQIVMQHLNTVPLVPSELVPGIPKGLDEIVMHAMCANISRRYASAEELYTDLERVKGNPDVRFGYSALVDDSGETQVIGHDVQQAARHAQAMGAQGRAGQAAAPRRTATAVATEPEGLFDRLAERPGLAAGIAVAVVAVITLVVVGILIMTGRGTGDKVEVPSFVGMNIDEVLSDATYTSNFTLQEASERVESDRPVGEILDQDVEAKSEVVKGTVITLTVSAGGENVSDTYKVVDFADRSLDYVTTMLDEHDISYTIQEEFSDEVESGHVIRTDPDAGTELEAGASITIYVSKGKETKKTTVPDLYGMTQEAAQQALTERGLSLGSVDPVTNQAAAGTVVWQSTSADTEVDQGTTINIQISSGPSQSTPDTDTSDDGDNSSGGNYVSEEPPAPEQGSATVQVTLPSSTDMAHVVVSVDGVVQYDETLETSMGSISVPLTSTAGEHEVTVSVDGSSSSQTYTFS